MKKILIVDDIPFFTEKLVKSLMKSKKKEAEPLPFMAMDGDIITTADGRRYRVTKQGWRKIK